MLELKDKVLRVGSYAPFYTIKSIAHWKTPNKYEMEFYEKPGTFPLDDYRKFIPEYTPENITSLKAGEIFVFGSNIAGIHGAGAAKLAREKFGAIYGQGQGLQGQSYAIVTTDLYNKDTVITDNFIFLQLCSLFHYVNQHPELVFYVTKIGCGLAGFTIERMRKIFQSVINDYFHGFISNNIVLPKEFE